MTAVFNPYQANRSAPGEPRRRPDSFTTWDGIQVTAPMRVTLTATADDMVDGQAQLDAQLDALAGPLDGQRWDLAEWSARPALLDPEGQWIFTAHYVWVPQLKTPEPGA